MKNVLENSVVIHLSANAVYTVVACQSACKTKVDILAIGVAKTQSFCHGKILHREKLVTAIKKSVREAEEIANVRVFTAIICLTSSDMLSANCMGEILIGNEAIANQHMAKVLSSAKNAFIPKEYYLAQFLPQMIWLDDEQYTVENAIGMTNIHKLSATYHLMARPVLALNNLYAVFKDCDIMVDNIIFDMVAGAEYSLIKEERERGVLFVDIGAKSTSFCVYKQNILVLSGCIATGGDDVTMDLVSELSIPIAEAERLKRHQATLIAKEEDKKLFVDIQKDDESGVVNRHRLSQIVAARYDLLFKEIFDRIEQANIPREFLEAGIVLSGEGSQAKDLVRHLKNTWRLPVHMTNSNQSIKLHPKRLSDSHFASMNVLIKERQLQTAFGAMMYHFGEDFHYQQRIYEGGQQEDTVLSKMGNAFNQFIGLIKRIS